MKHAVEIIAAFVRNIHLKRALTAAPGRNDGQNFWRVILASTLDMAVIEWCKLFGSDDEARQPVHWKNQVAADDHDSFRAGLLAATGLTETQWQEYWASVKRYRDQHAAHFDERFLRPENQPTYPQLDSALDATYFYYDWLIRRLDEAAIPHRYPRDLRAYCERFAEQAERMAREAYAATAPIEDRVL
jgi:hypothetical protein